MNPYKEIVFMKYLHFEAKVFAIIKKTYGSNSPCKIGIQRREVIAQGGYANKKEQKIDVKILGIK